MSQETCRVCAAPLPVGARFCPTCGAPVAASEGEERKFVTVLFADVIGSTRLATRLDPERYRSVMRAFAAAADEVVRSLRGRTEKFVGDAVMAVFGVPKAHEDDALRAVRAAVSIRERAERLGEDAGLEGPLRLRIGLNSGPVAAGSTDGDQLLVSGIAVNLAARLQQGADPGEILAGETTWRLTRSVVEFGDRREIAVRGFDHPVPAHPVLALSPRSSRRTIPFIGRARELELLLGTFQRTREASRPHLVTVLGEPGIGKSRLADELVASLPEETRVLRGSAAGLGDDVALAPIGQMLRDELGVGREASPEETAARLEDVVRGCCEPSEIERTTARLGLALGLGREEPGEHPYRVGEVRGGMEALLTGLAREGPVVLVFEDLHHAREDLLELIEGLLRRLRRAPLLVLCLARDELLESRPSWGAGIPDALTLRLEPLQDEEAGRLTRAAGGSLEDPTTARVVRVAGGNPYFIIETTGMLLEQPPGGGPARWVIPPTVQAAAASRIDHLPDPARQLLRTASVFPGGRFEEGELAAISVPDRRILEALEDAELLVPDPSAAERWRFRHEMIRQVAYDTLAKRERVRLHRKVAEALASEDRRRHAQAVAHHLELATRAALDVGEADAELLDGAIEALSDAGHAARRRIESRAAVDLYRRALALAGPEDGWGVREARLLAGAGEARYWLGEFDEARRTLERALEVGRDDDWTRAMAGRFLGDILLNVTGDTDGAAALFEDAVRAARSLDDPWAIARTLLVAGWGPYWRRDLEGSRRMFAEALEVARRNRAGDPWAESRALVSLASVTSPGGDEREVLMLAEEALEIGRSMGDAFTVAVALESSGNALRRMLRLDEALPRIDEAIASFRDLGARWELASAIGDRGYVHRLAARPEEAEPDLRESLDLCLELAERALTTWTVAQLALVLLQQDRLEDALALVEGDLPVERDEPTSASSIRMADALLALRRGHEERARELSAETIRLERKGGFRNQVASAVHWVGTVFGPTLAGGEEEVARARAILEDAGWLHAIREAELDRGQPKKTSASS